MTSFARVLLWEMAMVTYLLAGFATWFVAALGLGIGLGKLINAHQRPIAPNSDVRGATRAA
jgi:hypothetical protein